MSFPKLIIIVPHANTQADTVSLVEGGFLCPGTTRSGDFFSVPSSPGWGFSGLEPWEELSPAKLRVERYTVKPRQTPGILFPAPACGAGGGGFSLCLLAQWRGCSEERQSSKILCPTSVTLPFIAKRAIMPERYARAWTSTLPERDISGLGSTSELGRNRGGWEIRASNHGEAPFCSVGGRPPSWE